MVIEFSKPPHEKDLLTIPVNLYGKEYPVKVDGTGSIPCLVAGYGTLVQNTLSDHFKEAFTVYTSDLYWSRDARLEDPRSLTMRSICQDIQDIATQLGLKEYLLCGHSAFGIVALEIAKSDPRVKGVLMIGTPTASNEIIAKKAQEYFDKNADQGRKENDQKRREHYERIKPPGDAINSLLAYTSQSARYWADYKISDETLNRVWQGMISDAAAAMHLFGWILPHHNLEQGIEKVRCPVLLAGGPYDFDCIPLVLWRTEPVAKALGEKLTLLECSNSGHWPQFEEPDCFDRGVVAWTKKYSRHNEGPCI